jgi:polymorphic membrane protein
MRRAWLLAVGAALIVAAPAHARAGFREVRVPPAGRAVDTSHPDHVIGHGTPASCTSAAVIATVRAGGNIRFACGPKPVTIRMDATAKVRNTSARVVLDGGGLITLSGQGRHRILYMDTCDRAQVWTTSHCQDQATPELIVQDMSFTDGNSTGQHFDGGGGGAIFDRGGRLRIVASVFTGNRCDRSGPDLGGGAVRALSQYHSLPVYVTDSRFTGNRCSNGAALSSIGVSWTVLNSTFQENRAVGRGANPARPGTPGGGSGGAIYNDGDQMRLTIAGCLFASNHANAGGGAIFFVSNDRTGTMSIRDSSLDNNGNDGFQTPGLPGIFFLGAGRPRIIRTILR